MRSVTLLERIFYFIKFPVTSFYYVFLLESGFHSISSLEIFDIYLVEYQNITN